MKTFLKIIIGLVMFPCLSFATFTGSNTTTGGLWIEAGDGYNPQVVPFEAGGTGQVDSIWAYIRTSSSNRTVRMSLYSFTSRAFICSTSITYGPDTGWVAGAVNPSAQTITSGTKYFITVTTSGTQTDLQTYRTSASDSVLRFERSGIEPWPSTITLEGLYGTSYAMTNGVSYTSGVSATASICSTGTSVLWIRAALSGGTGTYDSVRYYLSSNRDSVVNLQAWVELNTNTNSSDTSKNTGLSDTTKYYYRVKAFDGGDGDTTAIDSVWTKDLVNPNPLTSCLASLIHMDYASPDSDSVKYVFEMPVQTAESVIVRYTTTGGAYPGYGSGTRWAKEYSSGSSDSVMLKLNNPEAWVIYFSGWVLNDKGDTSTVCHSLVTVGKGKYVIHR